MVETGPSPAFIFTLSLGFHFDGQGEVKQACPDYQSRNRNKAPGNELIPIFTTITIHEVITAELLSLRLDYCFGQEPEYNVSISTMGHDTKSGLATYGCVMSYGECDTDTPFRDISGGFANFVQLKVRGPQDYGPIKLLVRGDGRYGNKNRFTLAASAPRPT